MYDAIVVGAGPAGSAAAIALGRAGRRVLLLDRRSFPRDKPCGDLIGARAIAAAAALGVDLSELDRYPRIHGAVITTSDGVLELSPRSAAGRRLLAPSDARVVPRSVLDTLLVEHAVRSGAELRRAAVREVGPWEGGRRVVRGDGVSGSLELEAVAVVVAGGYGCLVASEVAPSERDDGPARGIAMRGYVRGVDCAPDRIVFSLDRWLLPGYGWVFPLPDGSANVGVGRLVAAADGEPRAVHLHELWRRFTEDPASPVACWLEGAVLAGRPRTWPLDLGPRRRRLIADGLAVVGEAAGLVGPLTGAGIAFALESGALAGATIADALDAGDVSRQRLRPYSASIRRRSAPWLRAELLAQRFFADPDRAERFMTVVRPLPPTGALGARLLLHLG